MAAGSFLACCAARPPDGHHRPHPCQPELGHPADASFVFIVYLVGTPYFPPPCRQWGLSEWKTKAAQETGQVLEAAEKEKRVELWPHCPNSGSWQRTPEANLSERGTAGSGAGSRHRQDQRGLRWGQGGLEGWGQGISHTSQSWAARSRQKQAAQEAREGRYPPCRCCWAQHCFPARHLSPAHSHPSNLWGNISSRHPMTRLLPLSTVLLQCPVFSRPLPSLSVRQEPPPASPHRHPAAPGPRATCGLQGWDRKDHKTGVYQPQKANTRQRGVRRNYQ